MFRFWKPIEGFETHEVSTFGEVRRVRDHFRLKPYDAGKGYLRVDLYRNGVRYSKRVHQLVMMAHGPPRPSPEHIPDHRDRNRANNRLDNLEWKTHAENMQNLGVYKTNTTGFPYIYRRGSRFQILKTKNGKLTHLGMIETIGL